MCRSAAGLGVNFPGIARSWLKDLKAALKLVGETIVQFWPGREIGDDFSKTGNRQKELGFIISVLGNHWKVLSREKIFSRHC